MKKIRWGILGLGSIAQVFAKSFTFCNHGQLVAISSQDRNKLNQFQNDFKIEDQYCFNNYKDLIKCNDIDIIYLALPNSLHFKWICECIDQEKNVQFSDENSDPNLFPKSIKLAIVDMDEGVFSSIGLVAELKRLKISVIGTKTKITNKEQSKIRFAGCDVLISKSSLVKNISSLIGELINKFFL